MTASVLVDDTNAVRIRYSDGQWVIASDVVEEFNSTSHRTTSEGATATFLFNGTSVSVFGTIPSSDDPDGPAVSSYTIDDTPSVIFTATPSPVTQFRQMFFQSPPLPDTQHQLIITNLNDSSQFWLDYFLYSPSASMAISGGTSGAASKGKKVQGASAGVVAGAIAGGTVFIALVILATYLFYRRKKRRRAYVLKNEKPVISHPEFSERYGTIEPYTLILPPPTHAKGGISRHNSTYKPDFPDTLGSFDSAKHSPRYNPPTGASLTFFPPPIITQPTRRPPNNYSPAADASPYSPYDQRRPFDARSSTPITTEPSVDPIWEYPRKGSQPELGRWVVRNESGNEVTLHEDGGPESPEQMKEPPPIYQRF